MPHDPEQREPSAPQASPDEGRKPSADVAMIEAAVGLLAAVGVALAMGLHEDSHSAPGSFPVVDLGPMALFWLGGVIWFFGVSSAILEAVRVLWSEREQRSRRSATTAITLAMIAATIPWWPMLFNWFGGHYKFG